MTAIVGRMGSGKTSLLKAILGEMPCQLESSDASSKCIIRGRVAYCSQNPLLINDSVKNNILLGKACDEQKLQKCIDLACLAEDVLA